MVAKTSPAILTALFKRFARRAQAETGVKVSMRRTSEELLSRPRPEKSVLTKAAEPGRRAPASKKDANALGRWTRPAKPNWFIPVGRVPEVARALGATQDELDALMMVRLQEVAKNDPENDVVVCGAWVAERVAKNYALDRDEAAVLAAFRHSRACTPYAVLNEKRSEQMQQFFENLVQSHLNELEPEAPEPEFTPQEDATLREKALEVGRNMLAKKVVPVAARKNESAEVIARKFLRRLRLPKTSLVGTTLAKGS